MIVPSLENSQVNYAVNYQKYAIQSDDNLEMIEEKVNKLIMKWYDEATKENISITELMKLPASKLPTSMRIKLCEKSVVFRESIKSGIADGSITIERLDKIFISFINKINSYSDEESKQLSLWLAQNTLGTRTHSTNSSVETTIHEGVFEIFSELPFFLAPLYDPSQDLKNYNTIITKAADTVEMNKANLLKLGANLTQILSNLSLNDALNFCMLKEFNGEAFYGLVDQLKKLTLQKILILHKIEEYRDASSYELARRQNDKNNKVKFQDLFVPYTISEEEISEEVISERDISEKDIKFLFGDYCSHIYKIELINESPFVDLNSIKLFPNLKQITLKNYKNKDLSLLESHKDLEILSLESCDFEIFDLNKLNKIKKIDFYCSKVEKFKISKLCPSVEILRLGEGFGVTGSSHIFNYLQFLPNLKDIDIFVSGGISQKQLDLFKYCPKLQRLKLSGCSQIKDFSILKQLTNLKHIILLDAHKLTEEKLLEIVDSCPKLKKIRLPGRTIISDEFLKIHLATQRIEITRNL
jgi:hypothetical protein